MSQMAQRMAARTFRDEAEGIKDEEKEEGTSSVTAGRLLKTAKPEGWLLFFGTIALVIASGTNLVVPALIGRIIDSLTTSTLDKEGALEQLRTSIFYTLILFAVSSFFSFVRQYIFTYAGERLVVRVRNELFQSIISQEIGFFDRTKTGEITNRLSADTAMLQNVLTVNVSMAVRSLITAIIGIGILFYTSVYLTLIMLAVLPIIFIFAFFFGRFIRKFAKKVQDALAKANEVAVESVSLIREVRAFSKEKSTLDSYKAKTDVGFKLSVKLTLVSSLFFGVVTLLANFAITAMLWFGGSSVINGDIDAGDLIAYILYVLTVAGSVATLTGLGTQFVRALGASERVFDIIDRDPRVPLSGGETLPNLIGNISFKDVTFAYPSRKDVDVLRNVSLDIPSGSVIALVGQSGSGKSTIAALSQRFYDVKSGAVTIDGVDIRKLDPTWLRQNVGVVSQEPTLFATSIYENITYGKATTNRAEVEEAARQANALEFINDFPDKFQTMVGERGVRLSGGQKQRIAIARALLKNPKILILDEATSALDAESEHLVQEALDRLMVGRTVIVIAHRLSTVINSTKVNVLLHGQLVESGTHTELLALDGVYKSLVEHQLSPSGPDSPSKVSMLTPPPYSPDKVSAARQRKSSKGSSDGSQEYDPNADLTKMV